MGTYGRRLGKKKNEDKKSKASSKGLTRDIKRSSVARATGVSRKNVGSYEDYQKRNRR